MRGTGRTSIRCSGSTARGANTTRHHTATTRVGAQSLPTGRPASSSCSRSGRRRRSRSASTRHRYGGDFAVDRHGHLGVATWRDVFGTLSPMVTVAASHNESGTDFGAPRLTTGSDRAQVFTQVEWQPAPGIVMRLGGDLDRLESDYKGSIPATGYDVRPGARTTVIASTQTGSRSGAFAEADWRPRMVGKHPDSLRARALDSVSPHSRCARVGVLRPHDAGDRVFDQVAAPGS